MLARSRSYLQPLPGSTHDIISGLWTVISADISGQWTDFTAERLAKINGDADAFKASMIEILGLTQEQASALLAELAQKYDSIEAAIPTKDFERQAFSIWSEVPLVVLSKVKSFAQFRQILSRTYEISSEAAWRQISAFLRDYRA